MRIFDLTHAISADMQVFPGTEQPTLRAGNTLEKDGFRETELCIFSHVGTHMDAPAHMLEGAAELDKMDISSFMGKAAVIPCMNGITMEAIDKYADVVQQADFLIFYTGQDALWGRNEYYSFKVPDREVIQYAVERGKKGVGTDCISVDPMEGSMPNHMLLFNAGMVIIENLCNLAELSGMLVDFMALPLKYNNADGAPVRAAAILA